MLGISLFAIMRYAPLLLYTLWYSILQVKGPVSAFVNNPLFELNNFIQYYIMKIPFLLAPMAELSHRALRELIEGFGGCDEYFSEMISAGALTGGGPFESYYTDAGPRPEKVVYQLMGADAGQLAVAAALLDRSDCAGIDINMGCSAPAIRKTGAGVGWMASIDRASAMIGRVRRCTKKRLSVKLRLGFEDDFEYLLRFCRGLESAGAELIILHPRTAGEKFKRRARWEYAERLRPALGIPVAGNGDIAGAADLARRAASGGVDALMTGRAALRFPWIFAHARALELSPALEHPPGPEAPPKLPAFIDLEETALRFLDLLARYQPSEFHKSRAHRFFSYFCDNLIWAHYLKTLLGREAELSAMAAVLSAYFREHPEERLLPLSLTPGPS
jgi:tRNA-dihydrouridine synthase